jgi:hypothetical protein
LQDPAACYTTIQIEIGYLHGFHVTNTRPPPGTQPSTAPEHGPQDLSIDLYKGKGLPWGPTCNPS